MLDIKVKGLFDVLNVCIGVNGNELETTMQIEINDLDQESKDQIEYLLNRHLDNMSASDIIRKLQF